MYKLKLISDDITKKINHINKLMFKLSQKIILSRSQVYLSVEMVVY